MGEKVIPSLFRLLFLWLPVMGSPWEKLWEYLCWTTWMWSNCRETPDMVSKRGWIWRQTWTRFPRLPRLRSLTDGNRSTVWEREQLPGESAKCSRDSLPGPSCSLSWSAAIGPHVLPLPSLTYGQAPELSLPDSLETLGTCHFCPVTLKCLSCKKQVLTHYLWTESQAEMTMTASVWVLRGEWPFSSRVGLALGFSKTALRTQWARRSFISGFCGMIDTG